MVSSLSTTSCSKERQLTLPRLVLPSTSSARLATRPTFLVCLWVRVAISRNSGIPRTHKRRSFTRGTPVRRLLPSSRFQGVQLPLALLSRTTANTNLPSSSACRNRSRRYHQVVRSLSLPSFPPSFRLISSSHRSEWITNQHRDTATSIVGHPALLQYLSIADGEATARTKFELTEVRLLPAFLPFRAVLTPPLPTAYAATLWTAA
jgi:hypothetical protein